MTALLTALLLCAEPVVDVRVLSPERPNLAYAIEITPAKGWHLYWKNPGDSGLPPSVKWELPEGWKQEELQFPTPQKILTSDMVSYGYEGKFALVGRLIPAADAKPGVYSIKGKLNWMACQESCTVGSSDVTMNVRYAVAFAAPNDSPLSVYEKAIPSSKVNAKAVLIGKSYQLSVPHISEWSAYFYSDSEGVVKHVKSQSTSFTPNGLVLSIPQSEFASEPSKRLTGVLVVTGPKGSTSYVIDTPVERGTEL